MQTLLAVAVGVISVAVAGIGAHMWLTFFDELRARRERRRAR